MSGYELIGLAGSVFVLVSFLMKNIKYVRMINIIGAIAFVVYGILIGAIATWFLNGCLILIHIIYLIKEYKNASKDK